MNTMQQEFDAVVNHLYAQGGKSVQGHQCHYRGPAGRMCAVGCRIPEGAYDAEMEGMRVDILVEQFAHVLPKEVVEYEVMFASLQDIHDNYYDGIEATWADYLDVGLKEVADAYDLTFTVPEAK